MAVANKRIGVRPVLATARHTRNCCNLKCYPMLPGVPRWRILLPSHDPWLMTEAPLSVIRPGSIAFKHVLPLHRTVRYASLLREWTEARTPHGRSGGRAVSHPHHEISCACCHPLTTRIGRRGLLLGAAALSLAP